MKKASMLDFMFFIIMLFVMGVVIFVFSYYWGEVNTAWKASDLPSESKTIINTQATKFNSVWDSWIIVAVIGYVVAIVIAALALPSHPAVAMVALVILIIFGGIAVRLSNAFYDFASTSAMQATASNLPMISLVMNRLPVIVTVLGILFIIILYAKTKEKVPTI